MTSLLSIFMSLPMGLLLSIGVQTENWFVITMSLVGAISTMLYMKTMWRKVERSHTE